MDHDTRKLVQESWTKVYGNEKRAADLLYSKLFALDSSIQFLFKGDLEDQKKRLMGMFNVAVRGLDKLDDMLPALRDLGARHDGYGVLPQHYGTLGKALLFTVEQELGDEFTDETRAAWTVAYESWSSAMKSGSQKAR